MAADGGQWRCSLTELVKEKKKVQHFSGFPFFAPRISMDHVFQNRTGTATSWAVFLLAHALRALSASDSSAILTHSAENPAIGHDCILP